MNLRLNRVSTEELKKPNVLLPGPEQVTGNVYLGNFGYQSQYYNFGTNEWQKGKMSTSTLEVIEC